MESKAGGLMRHNRARRREIPIAVLFPLLVVGAAATGVAAALSLGAVRSYLWARRPEIENWALPYDNIWPFGLLCACLFLAIAAISIVVKRPTETA